jgi:hypothetical protein
MSGHARTAQRGALPVTTIFFARVGLTGFWGSARLDGFCQKFWVFDG